jgi:large subunit ribosomal protein L1
MSHHGKKYIEAAKLLADVKPADLSEAVALLKKTAVTKFDSSCEIHIKLGVDPTQAEQMVRSTLTLPNGTGKIVRVIAFVPEDKVKEAKAAGAIKAGMEELIDAVAKGFTDFDIAVATPDAMKELGKVAKILGPKGLMPNPKAGTVTADIGRAIGEISKGRIEYRTDKLGQIHQIFGKVSFGEAELKENLKTFIKAIADTKPAAVKGTYIQNISVATTMGPGIMLDMSRVSAELK